MALKFISLFCGAGGEAVGLEEAGLELVLGVNHWDRAIETHSANFPHAEHLCCDINHMDMRRLPKADVLWASVICTEVSPAGGNKKLRGQQDVFADPVASAAYERTRACALDVIRACEAQRFKAVVVENVIDFARDWELFDWWVQGMELLGYRFHLTNASSAHLSGPGNDPAPQWRDRIYILFTLEKIPVIDLTPTPTSWCPKCEVLVPGVQTFKRHDRRKVGRYGQQYLYRCPECTEVVEPLVLPAATAIDWDNLGARIGDRRKPLAAATMRRIQAGIDMFAEPVVAAVAGSTYERPGSGYYRVTPSTRAPFRTITGTAQDALVTPQPFMVEARRNSRPKPVCDEPLATVTAGGNHHELVVPGSFIDMVRWANEARPRRVTEPLATITTSRNHALVVPYRRGRTRSTSEPLHALTTVDSAALCSVEVDIMDCHYRMLTPREQLRGQRFPDEYSVAGSGTEQTMQAGNAVSANAGHYIGKRLIEALG